MSVQDKPTPASGMPAAFARTPAAQSSEGEIAAPKSAEASAILAALDGIRAEVQQTREESRERGKETAGRLAKLEETTGFHADALRKLTDETAAHGKQIADIIEAQKHTASAASIAADLSAKALARASSAEDDTRKMVESAMAIQRGAIEAVVTTVVQPIRDDADALRVSDARQDRVQRALCGVMGVDYDAAAESSDAKLAKPKTNMVDLARGNQKAMGASLVTLAIIIAEIILRAMGASSKALPFGRD